MQWFVVVSMLMIVWVRGGSWDTPTKLGEDTRSGAGFIDVKAGVTHIVWCEKVAGKTHFLFYKQTYLNGTETPKKRLDEIYGCEETAVDGQGDGKLVIVVFSGTRIIGGTECNDIEQGGCLELFTKESKDGGATWSLSVPVPRNDIKDAANRTHPQLVHIRETGRTWLFYSRQAYGDEGVKLCYVQRPPNSIVFSPEVVLGSNGRINPSFTYTLAGGNAQVLHVVWVEKVDTSFIGYYSKSLDGGKTWSTPAALLRRTQEAPQLRLQSDPKSRPGYVVLSFTDEGRTKTLLRWSHDHGTTWSADITLSNHFLQFATAMCTLTLKAPNSEVFVLSAGGVQGEFGAYSFSLNQYLKEETPFPRVDHKTAPVVFCAPYPAKKVIAVKVLVAGGDSGHTLLHVFDMGSRNALCAGLLNWLVSFGAIELEVC